MTGADNLLEGLVSHAVEKQATRVSPTVFLTATICLIWYGVVSVVCIVGFTQL